MKIEAHIYLHEPSPELEAVLRQLQRVERVVKTLVDQADDRQKAKEMTAEVGATNTAIEAATPAPSP